MTSIESAASCTRNAMRRLVLALMFAFTAPDGRCVASTRCMPRLRPRCAMPISAPRKSGSSVASVANSSITTTRRGGVRALVALQALAMAKLGFERTKGALAELLVEVGHEADAVRQPRTLVERAAALVVDENEHHLVRCVTCRQAGNEGAQQLALAGSGRTGDESVRTVTYEIDLDHAVRSDADRDPVRVDRVRQAEPFGKVGARRPPPDPRTAPTIEQSDARLARPSRKR